MENSSFEQQFAQSLNSTPIQPVGNTTMKPKLPIIISFVLAIIVIIESIALVVTINNYLSATEDDYIEYEEGEDVLEEEEENDPNYIYDDNDSLVAMNASCQASDGSTITLDTDNNYTATGTFASSGTYTIVNDSLISLSNNSNVLYYDGWDIANGLTIYTCEQTDSTEE